MCVMVRVHGGVFLCVCEKERERERWRKKWWVLMVVNKEKLFFLLKSRRKGKVIWVKYFF
jgi:hypothetical protein